MTFESSCVWALAESPTLHFPRRYAFGLMLFELVVKSTPMLDEYRRKGRAAFIIALRAGMRPIIPSRVPVALAELMRRCWHGEPTRRGLPRSAIATLELALQSETAKAGSSAPTAAVAPALAETGPSPEQQQQVRAYRPPSRFVHAAPTI